MGAIPIHLAAIKILKENGVKRSDVIGAYYARRVASLMAHALPLYRMTPGVLLEGTMIADVTPQVFGFHNCTCIS
jgi:hypothetical protein